MEVKLTNVRLSFPQLFEAKEFKQGDGKPRYDATFLVVPGSANDKAIQAAIEAVGAEKFEKKWPMFKRANETNANKWAYLDGDTKSYDGYAGNMFLACHSKSRPLVIERDKTPLTAQDGKPYPGCYVNAKVEIYAQVGENPGIRASVAGVQFFRDGDAFSAGGPASTDDFDDVSDGADAEDFGNDANDLG